MSNLPLIAACPNTRGHQWTEERGRVGGRFGGPRAGVAPFGDVEPGWAGEVFGFADWLELISVGFRDLGSCRYSCNEFPPDCLLLPNVSGGGPASFYFSTFANF